MCNLKIVAIYCEENRLAFITKLFNQSTILGIIFNLGKKQCKILYAKHVTKDNLGPIVCSLLFTREHSFTCLIA